MNLPIKNISTSLNMNICKNMCLGICINICINRVRSSYFNMGLNPIHKLLLKSIKAQYGSIYVQIIINKIS